MASRYTTARMGFFGTFMNHFTAKAKAESRPVTFYERAGASLAAGGLGAILGNPADLALIRMQSDGLRPLAERKNYTSVVNALMRISSSEGVLSLWNGCLPTVFRAMALNFGQLAFYSESVAQMKKYELFKGWRGEEAYKRFGASAVAGFFASAFSLPFDFVKTRLQKQTKGPDRKLPYRGTLHCAMTVAKEEGLLRFYRGFGTYVTLLDVLIQPDANLLPRQILHPNCTACNANTFGRGLVFEFDQVDWSALRRGVRREVRLVRAYIHSTSVGVVARCIRVVSSIIPVDFYYNSVLFRVLCCFALVLVVRLGCVIATIALGHNDGNSAFVKLDK